MTPDPLEMAGWGEGETENGQKSRAIDAQPRLWPSWLPGPRGRAVPSVPELAFMVATGRAPRRPWWLRLRAWWRQR